MNSMQEIIICLKRVVICLALAWFILATFTLCAQTLIIKDLNHRVRALEIQHLQTDPRHGNKEDSGMKQISESQIAAISAYLTIVWGQSFQSRNQIELIEKILDSLEPVPAVGIVFGGPSARGEL